MLLSELNERRNHITVKALMVHSVALGTRKKTTSGTAKCNIMVIQVGIPSWNSGKICVGRVRWHRWHHSYIVTHIVNNYFLPLHHFFFRQCCVCETCSEYNFVFFFKCPQLLNTLLWLLVKFTDFPSNIFFHFFSILWWVATSFNGHYCHLFNSISISFVRGQCAIKI